MPTVVGNEGNLNGTTWVTVLAAPASAKQRWCDSVMIDNLDSAAVTAELRKNKGGVFTEIGQATIQSGAKAQLVTKSAALDATDESLEARIQGAPATTNPKFDVSAVETP